MGDLFLNQGRPYTSHLSHDAALSSIENGAEAQEHYGVTVEPVKPTLRPRRLIVFAQGERPDITKAAGIEIGVGGVVTKMAEAPVVERCKDENPQKAPCPDVGTLRWQ